MKRLTLPNSTKVVGISQTFSSTLAVKHDWSFCSSPAAHRLTNLVTGAVPVASVKLLPISTRQRTAAATPRRAQEQVRSDQLLPHQSRSDDETRFGINDKRGTLVAPELSHEDLAEMIGSSRPMVSKLIGDMIKEGLLARGEKRQFILRPKQSTSAVTPADVRSSVQWNGASKQAVGASAHARVRQSQTFPSRPQNGSYGTMFK